MKQVIQNLKTGITELIDIPIPILKPGHVLIRTKVSLISAGTEKMLLNFSNSNYLEKALQQPERLKEVIDKTKTDGIISTWNSVQNKLDQPITLGYSNVGEIIEIGEGVDEFKVGQRVISNGSHGEIVLVPKNLCAVIPNNVSDKEASLVILGSIGLQGIRLANPTLGETFLVSGLGLIGILTSQLLLAQGCNVIGLDIDQAKCDLAASLGIETINLSKASNATSFIFNKTNHLGVDGVIITAQTKSSEPVHLAAKVCRQRGRIILVGVTGLELNRDLFYKKEITFQVSCSYGPGRYDPKYEIEGNDYPYGLVRWTEKRNMEAVLMLLSKNNLKTQGLISHTFNLENINKAYNLLLSQVNYNGILINYPNKQSNITNTININEFHKEPRSNISSAVVAFIGAGNYASSVLIPAFYKAKANLSIIASNNGLNPVILARRYRFNKASTNIDSIFKDEAINTVVITTRHNTHASLIIKALSEGKNIFVEKPICLNKKELEEIKNAYNISQENLQRPIVMVGFNRRFSPLITKTRSEIKKFTGPKSVIYTCNAGEIDSNHWIHNKKLGGGRLIGEACHFVDLIKFLLDSKIISLEVLPISNQGKTNDTFSIQIKFEDGSIASIHYISIGAKSFPKERIEVFCSNSVLQLDNFRTLKGWGIKGFKNSKLLKQDKGQVSCVKSFISAIESGGPSPISFEELYEVQRHLLSSVY